MRIGYFLISASARLLLKLLFGLRVHGIEHVPRQGRLLLAANHQSYLDPPLMGGIVPREIHFMAKRELFNKPLLGGLIRYCNALPVSRSGQDLEALRTAEKLLQKEQAILLFPEGTRSKTGQFLHPSGGIGLLAKQTEAPVLPVYIRGTRGAWKRLLRRQPIQVYFGLPLERKAVVEKSDSTQLTHREFAAAIMREIAALKAAAE